MMGANKICWVNVDGQFSRPLDLHVGGKVKKKSVKGFMQEVGITLQTDEVLEIELKSNLLNADEQNNVKIIVDRVGIIESDNVREEILEDSDINESLLADPNLEGVWYKSGRGYYS